MKQPFSIWSSFDIDLSPEDMVLAMEDRGLTVCELSDEHAAELLKRPGDPYDTGKTFRDFAASHGLSFPQGHLWLRVRLCDSNTDSVGILKNWLKLFAGIGIKNAVLHCDAKSFPEGTPINEIYEANAQKLRPLAKTAEELGIRICLENLSTTFQSAKSLLEVINRVNSPALGICLDTGHLNISGVSSQKEFILNAGDRLHALHIADNEGQADQHMMPFGRGTVDFADVMAGLKEIGYSDLFNYEIPGERNLPPPLRKAKAAYLQEVTDYLFSL